MSNSIWQLDEHDRSAFDVTSWVVRPAGVRFFIIILIFKYYFYFDHRRAMTKWLSITSHRRSVIIVLDFLAYRHAFVYDES